VTAPRLRLGSNPDQLPKRGRIYANCAWSQDAGATKSSPQTLGIRAFGGMLQPAS